MHFSARYTSVRCHTFMTSALKRKMVKIGTHSGSFHCDEALGCFLLKRTKQYQDAEIIRTRDADVLSNLDVVIDVGGTYNAGINRFDHHQRGFSETFGHGFNTKLSSAGLVYKHYGKEIIADYMGKPADNEDVNTIFLSVYRHFIEAVDAVDNGINQWESADPPKYLNGTTLSARVGQLNPRWNDDSSDAVLDDRFQKAVTLTGSEFLESLDYLSKCWLPARSYVKAALASRFDVDASGEIIQLDGGGFPWKEHLYDLEKELSVPTEIKFVLYEDTREKKWRVQAVSVGPGSFQNRKSLPAAWRGLRDNELSEKSSIPGCVFVHAAGFIGGNATREGAIEMARRGLTEE